MKKSELRQLIREELLSEAKEIDAKTLKNIAQLTDRNNGNLARVEMARLIPNKDLVMAYEGMEAMNDLFHSMPPDLLKVRAKLDKMLEYYLDNKYTNFSDVSW